MADGNGGSAGKRPDAARYGQADGISGPAADTALRPSGNRPAASRPRYMHRVISIVIVIAAVVSVAYGVVFVAHAREFLAHHRTTGGVVTAVNPDVTCGDYGCSTSYDWTVRYQPQGSGPLTFTYGEGDSTPVGTHVLVYYLDRDPGVAKLDPGTREQADGIVLLALGLVGFAIGYWMYRSGARWFAYAR